MISPVKTSVQLKALIHANFKPRKINPNKFLTISPNVNAEQFNYIQQFQSTIANFAKANNKKLIFMLPSSMREFEYKELFPILNNLKNIDLLLMCDGNKFPELYEAKNNLEADHYNKYGTEVFSQYLGQEFNKLNTNKN